MTQPSTLASNTIIYLSYGSFLIFGLYLAWRLRFQSTSDFLSGNRSQTAIPLALNFIASALGSGILFSYPQLATITGVQGMVTYAATTSAPLLIFAYLGPLIRKKCSEGFVLTEWTRQRYGVICALYLSFLTCLTMFLYMVAELSALQQITMSLTGIDGLRFIIVQVLTTTFYTSLGGFKISFITDNIQGAMVIGLSLLPFLSAPFTTRNNMYPVAICTITIGLQIKIDPSRIESSGLTKTSLLGWQLLYILPIAVLTNDFFLSNFWIRTFASKTDEDLWVGILLATVGVFIILTLVGSTGLIAVWSGVFDPSNPDQDASIAFFHLLENLPAWTVGIVLVMVVTLSTAAFDSLQSAMVSTASNDLFRNRLNIWWVRLTVVLTMIPVCLIAIKAPSILQIYLITDLISASMVPVLVIGLLDCMDFWSEIEVMVGGIGGLFSVFAFGTIYYGNTKQGMRLLLLENGLYTNDWSVLGAFVAAPFGGLLCGLCAFSVRIGYKIFRSLVDGVPLSFRDRRDHSLPTTPSIHCREES